MLPDLGHLAKEHAVTDPAGRSPATVIDTTVFGRYLRSLRMRQGFETGRDFVEALRRDYGVDVSERTLYAIERGEQMPRLDFAVAALAALDVDLAYFYPAVRSDVVSRLRGSRGSA
jgi:transcriptional regulator with XRE-family HTH domain